MNPLAKPGRAAVALAILLSLVAIPRTDALNLSGLVGYWAFDEGGGSTAADGSPMDNDAVLTNAAWAAGKHGSGLALGGPATPRSPV